VLAEPLGFFADTPYMQLLPFAAHLGIFPFTAKAESANAPPSVEDIARCATAVLMSPGGHAGRTYHPTGPDLLTVTQMAATISKVVGRRVKIVPMPPWLLAKAVRMGGFTEFTAIQCALRDPVPGAGQWSGKGGARRGGFQCCWRGGTLALCV
jgi:uncharacterized protein YbjT (DUF2867 family)